MSPVAFEVAQLFDGFPEPVLILRDREVRYRNPAAERLFPALRDRATLPEDLSALLPECEAPAVVTARIGGGNYRLSVQNTSLGALVILRSAPAAAAASSERLSRYLRQQTAGLAAALQRLGADPEGLDPARQVRYLSIANQGLYRLLRLADHLDFLERDDASLYRPAPMDLAGLCRELGREISGVAAAAGYGFAYESELASLLTLGDPSLLRRMLLALLSNAMKAAGPGGKLGLRLARSGQRAVLTVWDGGNGLAEGDLSLLFGGEPAGGRAGTGLGTGLESVRPLRRLFTPVAGALGCASRRALPSGGRGVAPTTAKEAGSKCCPPLFHRIRLRYTRFSRGSTGICARPRATAWSSQAMFLPRARR